MSKVLLSDVKIGTPREHEQERERFLDRFTDKDRDWRKKILTQSVFYRTDNLPKTDVVLHRNYMTYLQKCWSDHLGAVFTPDILWNSLLCELASIVKAAPETYRSLFTDSPDKKDVLVISGDPVLLPLNVLIDALKDLVPTDTASFLPEFSTSTLRSKHAFNANFADMCSPYYNYMMMCCNIPVVDVQGTEEDYQKVVACWDKLTPLFQPEAKYMGRVSKLLNQIVAEKHDPTFWQSMFKLERCGSGSDVEVSGWWTEVYKEKPSVLYPENFASHIAKVSYTNIDDGKKYVMYDGLFYSKMNDDTLEPNFGFIVYEQGDKTETPYDPYASMKIETGIIGKKDS